MSEITNQIEHEQISTSLEVETIETNLYRSKSLWLPFRARGVFGGQVISQALVSATNTVNPQYSLHSLHCYFLTSASSSTPIVYEVERVRNGRSYVTRAVKAIQNGSIVFVMMCSFQKPEPWQPSHHWPMPVVAAPEACLLEEDRFAQLLKQGELDPKVVETYNGFIRERTRSPIAIKLAKERDNTPDGTIRYMYWMKARSIPKYEAHFQKCILSYLSDLYFIGTLSRTLGLRRGGQGSKALSMTSTLDHTIYFYSDDLDCGEWLLYVMESPRTGYGRGVIHGRIYTRNGTLVAVTSQEGVIRANIRGPVESATTPTAKL